MSVEHQGDVIVQLPFDGCCVLTINRPAVRNALSEATVEELLWHLDRAEQNDSLHALVLQGNGSSFCSGFDLSDLESETDASLTWRFLRIETLLQRLFVSRLRIISLAQGHVFGAGADLLVASQTRILDPHAKLRFPGAQFGICLGFGRLSERTGGTTAMDIVDRGRVLSASDALTANIATELVDQSGWAERLAQLGGETPRIHPVARREFIALVGERCAERDMASIARTASMPGLKMRISEYVHRKQYSPRAPQASL